MCPRFLWKQRAAAQAEAQKPTHVYVGRPLTHELSGGWLLMSLNPMCPRSHNLRRIIPPFKKEDSGQRFCEDRELEVVDLRNTEALLSIRERLGFARALIAAALIERDQLRALADDRHPH